MELYDLSHTISSDMPVYPGTEPPSIEYACTLENDGFLEKRLVIFSHTGTHIDAPAHLIPGAKTLDEFPLSQFFGQAFVLDLTSLGKLAIDLSDLKPYRSAFEASDFILLRTGWSRRWGTPSYFTDYPVLSLDAAKWLSDFAIKGLGLDTISADPFHSVDFKIHLEFLLRNRLVIENLTHLERLPSDRFTFSCFPLKMNGADGSPVRAVAMVS